MLLDPLGPQKVNRLQGSFTTLTIIQIWFLKQSHRDTSSPVNIPASPPPIADNCLANASAAIIAYTGQSGEVTYRTISIFCWVGAIVDHMSNFTTVAAASFSVSAVFRNIVKTVAFEARLHYLLDIDTEAVIVHINSSSLQKHISNS